jgi:hypothetical protein
MTKMNISDIGRGTDGTKTKTCKLFYNTYGAIEIRR